MIACYKPKEEFLIVPSRLKFLFEDSLDHSLRIKTLILNPNEWMESE